MAVQVKHAFTCAIADDAAAQAAGEVLPSHWNAALSTSMATGFMLGRLTAGTGPFEELSAAQILQFLKLGVNAPSATMFMAAAQTGIANGTMTKVNLDTADADSGGMVDTANHRIVIPSTGRYLLVGMVVWSALGGNSARTLTTIRVNDAEVAKCEGFGPATGFPAFVALRPMILNANDAVTLHGFHLTGGTESFYGANPLANGGSQLYVAGF